MSLINQWKVLNFLNLDPRVHIILIFYVIKLQLSMKYFCCTEKSKEQRLCDSVMSQNSGFYLWNTIFSERMTDRQAAIIQGGVWQTLPGKKRHFQSEFVISRKTIDNICTNDKTQDSKQNFNFLKYSFFSFFSLLLDFYFTWICIFDRVRQGS